MTRTLPRPQTECVISSKHPVVTVLLSFAAGYYISYLFRTINALASAALGPELVLGAAELGTLTSAYFLTFAAMQVPIGVALDLFGPRRVQLVLLPVAAAGSAIFAVGQGIGTLLLGRALIGLGVAAALMAGLKALALWLPKERLALANGCYITLGALGAVTATGPAETLMQALGWRGLFAVLSAATALVAVAIWLFVPADPVVVRSNSGPRPRLRDVYCDVRFWHIAPVSACCIGTAFALQGLWAGPWLTDVALLDRAGVVRGLFIMALGLCTGAATFGIIADRLRRRGVRSGDILLVVATASILVQLALVLRLGVTPEILWCFIGAVGSTTVLSYATIGEIFPKDLVGRANGLLNLLHTGLAFVIQAGIGLIVDCWPVDASGHYPATAYATALGLNLVPQILALAWFAYAPVPRPHLRQRQSGFAVPQAAMELPSYYASPLSSLASHACTRPGLIPSKPGDVPMTTFEGALPDLSPCSGEDLARPRRSSDLSHICCEPQLAPSTSHYGMNKDWIEWQRSMFPHAREQAKASANRSNSDVDEDHCSVSYHSRIEQGMWGCLDSGLA